VLLDDRACRDGRSAVLWYVSRPTHKGVTLQKSSLFYQLLLQTDVWYFVAFVIVEVFVYIYKRENSTRSTNTYFSMSVTLSHAQHCVRSAARARHDRRRVCAQLFR
jgi:hypothetical protein